MHVVHGSSYSYRRLRPVHFRRLRPLSMSELTKKIQQKVMGVGDTVDDDADGSDDDASIKRTSANKKPLKTGQRTAAVKKSGKKQPTVKKGATPIKKKGGKTNKGKTTSAVAKGGKRLRRQKTLTTASRTAPPKTSTRLATIAEKPSTPIRSGRCGESNQGGGVVTTRCSLSKVTLARHGMKWSRH